MKNEMSLDQFNVIELNEKEKTENDGGFWPLILIGAALLLDGCTGCAKKIVPQRGASGSY